MKLNSIKNLWLILNSKDLGEVLNDISTSTRAIANEKKRLTQIFDTFPAVVYVRSLKEHKILYANDNAKEQFGFDIVGKKCHEVLQELNTPCEFCAQPNIIEKYYSPHMWVHENYVNHKKYLCIDWKIQWENGKLIDAHLEIAICLDDIKNML